MSDTNLASSFYDGKYTVSHEALQKLFDDIESLKKRVDELEKLNAKLDEKIKFASLGFSTFF